MEPILAHLTDIEAVDCAAQLRQDILQTVSQTGGHLASNLGAVELTIAIHRVFDTSVDRLVFDVGHQCYAHKIITGRRAEMHTLRQYDGLSGFPKPHESEHDAFIAGHASNSISVALGMARARTLKRENYSVLALIGDGALTGGLAYEGLCDAGTSGEPLIILMNDNGMSISKNVGAIGQYLAKKRLKPQYLSFKKGYRRLMGGFALGRQIYKFTHVLKKRVKDMLLPTSIYESLGFTYLGPVDGHDISGLTKLLTYAKELKEPVIIHLRTIKGMGYAPAMQHPDAYHGVGAFHLETGELKKAPNTTYSDIFSNTLCELARTDTRICAITAAMEQGTSLGCFREAYPTRFFDVGIAEGHAVSMAAGLAKQGMIPVFAVYSSFLQRSYDMLVHDIALLGLHVVFAIDRAGLVGEDGETHHGVFDTAFLDSIPGMTVLAPSTFQELHEMLRYACSEMDGPVAIRYPRGMEEAEQIESRAHAASEAVCKGDSLTIVSHGSMVRTMQQIAQRLEKSGFSIECVKVNRLTPLDAQPILLSAQKTKRVLVIEEAITAGSVAQKLALALARTQTSVAFDAVNLGENFTRHGTCAQLRAEHGLDEESLYQRALAFCQGGNHE